MIPKVVLRTPDDCLHTLRHGSLIGRIGSADLILDDVRVSEAHAMVSLRGGQLQLLALRGRFALNGTPLSSLTLETGQQIFIAQDLMLEVTELVLPTSVLALESNLFPRMVLAQTTAVIAGPPARILEGYRPDADALFWSRDGHWYFQPKDQPARPVEPGQAITVGTLRLDLVHLELNRAGSTNTAHTGRIAGPLRIVAAWDSVQIHQDDQLALVLSGIPARLLSELAVIGGPVEWESLATQVWGPDERFRLRRKLDQSILRLRRKLEASQIRSNLIHSDGKGLLEVLLHQGDVIVDRT